MYETAKDNAAAVRVCFTLSKKLTGDAMHQPSRLTDGAKPGRERPPIWVSGALLLLAVLLGLLSPIASLLRLVAVAGIATTFAFALLKVPGFPFWTMLSIGGFVFFVGLGIDVARHALTMR